MINNAQKILSYWLLLELLKQDSLPKMGRKINKNSVKDIELLQPTGDILSQVIAAQKQHKMDFCSNITLYIGSVIRNKCVERIVDILGKDIDAPDKRSNNDIIAWASMQFTANGKYIDNSFSLSPLLWAIDSLANDRSLAYDKYMKCVSDWEITIQQTTFSSTTTNTDNDGNIQTIVSFFQNEIYRLQQKLYDRYLKDAFANNVGVEDSCIISYKIANASQYVSEDDYHGLSMNFFADDIDMLKRSLDSSSEFWKTEMGKAIVSYINSPTFLDVVERTNLAFNKANSLSKNELYHKLFPILNVNHAPQAKWPSKYMPAFMQQVAVNLFTVNNNQQSIFSVNGPPGTGKTTMLKEIVVNNVVERAKLLAEYQNPDNAFDVRNFSHGQIDGKNGYKKYYQYVQGGYFVLKNDKINDYGIVVASCNNAAVENISKELPRAKDIISSFDNDEAQKHIRDLFDVSKSLLYEDFVVNGKVQREKDIYFSRFTSDLLGTKDSAWGLIAAALGKKENVRQFATCVLNPLKDSFFSSNKLIEKRQASYLQAREKFLSQWEKVQSMQKHLEENCKAVADFYHLSKLVKDSQDSVDKLHHSAEQWKRENYAVIRSWEIANTKLSRIMDLREAYQYEGLIFKHRCKNEHNERIDKLIATIENESDDKRDILLLEEWCGYIESRKQEILQSISAWNNKKYHRLKILFWYIETNREFNHFIDEYVEYLGKELVELEKQRKEVLKLQENIEHAKAKLKDCENEYIKQKKMVESIKAEKISCFDDDYMDALLSDDTKISTKAQVGNPWFTDAYNRAREELFWLAMQVHKEFLLSSKCCRDNLINLMLIWDVFNGNNNRIIYHIADRKCAVPALLQTLSLLVPVISTTFAAVGRFLCDVEVPGTFGTLIVDEAGQAEPQMALGALYRARKAIIVGDPKQVEPVVTDELDLLKSTYTENIYNGYIDKGISVQQFADNINKWGIYLTDEDGNEKREWLGCPLLVHRRCINPMYEISNQISYGGIMKKQTAEPSEDKMAGFLYSKSCWFDIAGSEKGNKDHFVQRQGEHIVEMMRQAFQKSQNPNIYIISPFNSVVNGVKLLLKNRLSTVKNISEWCDNNIGTVHKFQGKEADEVIFVLGCDSSPQADGAVNWVNSNIVNVAVTRAKYRLYVVGDRKVWKKSYWVRKMMNIMEKKGVE
ncbi:AAA domain-containing protein [Selenomonas ruminantium]|uniref:AAA domain-containing protein n=1 Tax=Selenomonas ruminantium TaxID=971 RepID=A0A1M6T756_SELRU|nr:DEAD/DEAH box helicase [Selenomonas ruminantium]SHK52679.1 AAA domain-containing protein [Selenomonas ruminantium]